MASNLERGAYTGRETFLYYDSAGDWSNPTWVEIARARNLTVNDGPALSDVEFHGTDKTSQVPGYAAFNGSFEYVRRVGTDTVWDALKAARDGAEIIHLMHLNGPENDDASIGWKAPVLFGESPQTDNGSDPTVATINFGLADAYDASDNQIGVEPAQGTTPP